MKLIDILNTKKYKTDKHTVHQYIQEYYEDVFSEYKDKSISLLEIGVLHGESLKLWSDYFSDIQLVGIDIFIRVPYQSVENNVKDYDVVLEVVDSFSEDLSAQSLRSNFIKKYSNNGFDIIIDDGLHSAEAQYKTFNNFKSLMNPGGVYIIEDIRDESVNQLSKIENINFLHLPDNHHPKGKQYIAEIKF